MGNLGQRSLTSKIKIVPYIHLKINPGIPTVRGVLVEIIISGLISKANFSPLIEYLMKENDLFIKFIEFE